ncbi:helix-turn-helix domain-containing protein [Mycobacterium malmoense]|uniref:helix-turn-helix domain-containing protein n=1 Tax=Mycobacterium malmoense TaxID=1780 RepID=UPI0009F5F100|nr:helix-turn-helix transcriptional regulator [Mycobacterium malmoense]
MPQGSKYQNQRKSKTPPHVPAKYVRLAAGLTLEAVAARIKAQTNRQYSVGAISAIESGTRGGSPELMEAYEAALGLPPGTIRIDYIPRAPRGVHAQRDEAAE